MVGQPVGELNFSTVFEKVHMERVVKILLYEICIHCIAQSNRLHQIHTRWLWVLATSICKQTSLTGNGDWVVLHIRKELDSSHKRN